MFRKSRFFVLEKLVAPVAVFPLDLLVRTWRLDPPDENIIREVLAQPRLMLVTFHGMLFHLLAFARVAERYGRRLTVITSPSRDGRVLGVVLKHFGIEQIAGATGGRAVGGSMEFIKRVVSGLAGVVAIDGPRGPCCVAKAGFLRLAAAAEAQLLVVATSASSGLRFGSWDRAHLPLPFARVTIRGRLMPVPVAGNEARSIAGVQAALLEHARQIRSPVLPPEFCEPPE